jgi:hypothetical protein
MISAVTRFLLRLLNHKILVAQLYSAGWKDNREGSERKRYCPILRQLTKFESRKEKNQKSSV